MDIAFDPGLWSSLNAPSRQTRPEGASNYVVLVCLSMMNRYKEMHAATDRNTDPIHLVVRDGYDILGFVPTARRNGGVALSAESSPTKYC